MCGWATARVQPTPAGTFKIQTTVLARKTVSPRLETRASGMMRPAESAGCLFVRSRRVQAWGRPAVHAVCCWAVLACPQLHDCAPPSTPRAVEELLWCWHDQSCQQQQVAVCLVLFAFAFSDLALVTLLWGPCLSNAMPQQSSQCMDAPLRTMARRMQNELFVLSECW